MPAPAPRLDSRDAAAVLAGLWQRLPAYLPGWQPPPLGSGQALLQIFARYMEVLIERLNSAPDKNLLAFLDLLGQSLVEAQAARAPVVFTFTPPAAPTAPATAALTLPGLTLPAPTTPLALPGLTGALPIRVPEATQVAAGDTAVFETEYAIALTGAQLAQVVSLWPGQDSYADHSAALRAGAPVLPFRAAQGTPHHVYLAHDSYFTLNGPAQVEIEIDLVAPASAPLPVVWETWDGQSWQPFGDPTAGQQSADDLVRDSTEGLTRSGVVLLRGDCVTTAATMVAGSATRWLRGRPATPLPPDLSRKDPLVRRIRVNTIIERLLDPAGLDAPVDPAALPPTVGVPPDQALADSGQQLDLSKAFYPFGANPQPGSVFYLASEEVFSKPGAQVRLALATTTGAAASPVGASGATITEQVTQEVPTLAWEYWDGATWRPLALGDGQGQAPDFTADGIYRFTVPERGIPHSTILGKEGRWIRARIVRGGYVARREVTTHSTVGDKEVTSTVVVTETRPPLLAGLRLAYLYRAPRVLPERCLTYNDFTYTDQTAAIRWPGAGFPLFQAVGDGTPALYFGFDRPLPTDRVSLYLDIQEQAEATGPPLTWETWNGLTWSEIAVQDDTARLTRPGMLGLIGPGDSVALARFAGSALVWLRGRLREDGPPPTLTINGIFLNAVWARQAQTVRDELLGSGNGEPDQTFFLAHNPVLGDEVIEVRELDGPRAAVELPILAREIEAADLNVVSGGNGPPQVWVRWRRRPSLAGSGPQDRHYLLERSTGRLIFGDGVHGRPPPAGRDNVIARVYRWGGGAAGNVPAGAISQLRGGVPYVSGVTNPRAAEGGAAGETPAAIRRRGPQALRHRGRALSTRDYESLAQEASPGIALARALPAMDPNGRPAPGWVTLIIVPQSQEARPQPSFGLRRAVYDYVRDRAPATLAGLFVTGPAYHPVGAAVTVAPRDASQAGPVGVAVRQALEQFFHPLTGGPGGGGWPFGRAVYLSDVAALLEAQTGVDYVQELELLLDGIPQGEQVPVPGDQIVVAGAMRVRLRAVE